MITNKLAVQIANNNKRGLGRFITVCSYPDLISSIFWYSKGSICVAMTDGRCIVHKDEE